MEIRLAETRDLVAINAIYNQAIRQRFCTAHLREVDLEYTRLWFEKHLEEQYPVYVAESEALVLGWVSIGPYRSDRQALSHVAEISYYVDQDSRRQGIGSELLAFALARAPEKGLSVLVAILLDKNPPSIALLEKFGFARWGTMPGIAQIGAEKADHLYYGLFL
jgi:phosphinothricin acetyltransferase